MTKKRHEWNTSKTLTRYYQRTKKRCSRCAYNAERHATASYAIHRVKIADITRRNMDIHCLSHIVATVSLSSQRRAIMMEQTFWAKTASHISQCSVWQRRLITDRNTASQRKNCRSIFIFNCRVSWSVFIILYCWKPEWILYWGVTKC